MTATANPLKMRRDSRDQQSPAIFYKLKIDTKIPAGTLAMRVLGNDYVEPYVGNTNNAILMGVAEKTYDNTGGVAVKTYGNDDPMVFNRGTFFQFLSDGTITFDDVGALVGLKDNQTIGHTVAANDATAELLGIIADRSGATSYAVRIKQAGPT